MSKITTFLTFNDQAGDAMEFYLDVFKNSEKISVKLDGAGKPFVCTLRLEDEVYTFLNAGPMFAFTGAVSLMINCADQAEVDYYWERLLEGGQPMACGWLTDKFGVVWQITPIELMRLMSAGSPAQQAAAMTAMQSMIKLDIHGIRAAHEAAGA